MMSDEHTRTELEEHLRQATLRIINREANMQQSGMLVDLENDSLDENGNELLHVIISSLHGMQGLNGRTLASYYDFQVRFKLRSNKIIKVTLRKAIVVLVHTSIKFSNYLLQRTGRNTPHFIVKKL